MENNFEWCGFHWKVSMEGNRLIHPDYPWMWYDHSQVMLSKDNTLELFLKKRPAEIYFEGNTYYPSIACGLIRSEESFDFGTFSAEICLPQGRNLWPSFWITGDKNWPPEIDIMEAWLDDKGSYFRLFTPQFPWLNPSWRTTTNVYYNNKEMQHEHCGSKNIPYCKQSYNPSENFIKYSCVWQPDSITFFADGKQVRKITGKECQYLYENLIKPKEGYKINAVFNVFCENPEFNTIDMVQPMLIKNFKYQPL